MQAFIYRVARVFAILGGLVLSAVILLTCFSIAGRLLNSLLHGSFLQSVAPSVSQLLIDLGIGPITGDYELVEVGMAFTIFAFLPLCQLTNSHASVDLFTAKLSIRMNRILRLLIESIFAAALILIALKLFSGMETKRTSGQTSFLIQFPVWWGYMVCLPAAFSAAFISVVIAVYRFIEVLTGRTLFITGTAPKLESISE